MMSSIFYGEIKENRLNTWKENKNPYEIAEFYMKAFLKDIALLIG